MTADGVLIRQDVGVIKRSAGRRLLWLAVLVVVLLVIVMVFAIFGVRAVSLDNALAALSGRIAIAGQAVVAGHLPRMVLGLLSGMSLAIAGGAAQAIIRDPLADLGILEVLSGTSLAVVIGLVFSDLSHPYAQLLIAALGAGVAAGSVYSVGSLGRDGTASLKLALAGITTSVACSSLVSAILLPRVRVIGLFQFQQIGRIGGTTWDRVEPVAPFLMVGTLICLFSARGVSSLVLGGDVATGLGEDVVRTRPVASIGAMILCGATTAVCRPIVFVGLIVLHLCRPLVGTDYRWTLPFAGLADACLSLAIGTLGQVITPNSEIDVDIITLFLGAPFFIQAVRHQKVCEL